MNLKILIVTPAPAGSTKGNRVTALRWARLLRELGHTVSVRRRYAGGQYDLLIALHARRSAASAAAFKSATGKPLVVALTGTDLYRDLPAGSVEALHSLEIADRLVVLQPLALRSLPAHAVSKARVIFQSVRTGIDSARPSRDNFRVCVLGHLRPVKDPFRAALAARRLPPESRIRIVQVGAALSPAMRERAEREMAAGPRYRWLGEMPRRKALRQLARSHLLLLTSLSEGGANTISEAIALSVPVVASRIDGATGILGEEYPGYYTAGDTDELAALLLRCERDTAFYEQLCSWCAGLKSLVEPEREREAWRLLLKELFP